MVWHSGKIRGRIALSLGKVAYIETHACAYNGSHIRLIHVNRMLPYHSVLYFLLHEFGHIVLYIVFNDVFGFDTDNKNLCHRIWDLIHYPPSTIRKTDVYKAFYETETWVKEQDEKSRLM